MGLNTWAWIFMSALALAAIAYKKGRDIEYKENVGKLQNCQAVLAGGTE